MRGKKRSFVFLLVVSVCILISVEPSVAKDKEQNRCRQRKFGQFSDWSTPVNLGPVVNSKF